MQLMLSTKFQKHLREDFVTSVEKQADCKTCFQPSQMKDNHCERNMVISSVLALKHCSFVTL